MGIGFYGEGSDRRIELSGAGSMRRWRQQYQSAIDILDAMKRGTGGLFPAIAHHDLAIVLHNRGNEFNRLYKPRNAIEDFARALEVIEEVRIARDGVLARSWRFNMASNYVFRAMSYRQIGNLDFALRDASLGIGLLEDLENEMSETMPLSWRHSLAAAYWARVMARPFAFADQLQDLNRE